VAEGPEAWASLDATAQAALVASGEVSPGELVEAAARRIEAVDARLGAVPIRLFDDARRAARRAGDVGRFHGVPFLMKDVGARQAGQPYYAANRALRDADHRAEADTPLGARFREVGLVTVGKSNSPEFGLQSNTWPLVYGPTRNPWEPSRSAGGSSGGACAAVAAGLVPVAHASDGAGSIRIPAAWCGLVGFKPTRDRIVWRHAAKNRSDVEFVVARSLRDTAVFADVLRAATPADRPAAECETALATHPPRLRIGVCVGAPVAATVDPDCRDAVVRAADRLAAAGHAVETAAPASLGEQEERSLHGAVLGPAEFRECLEELAERLGRDIGAGDVEPYLWELSQASMDATEDEIAEAARWGAEWVGRTLRWFEAFDLLVTPTVNEPAKRLDDVDPARLAPFEMLDTMLPNMAFTEPWNATGQPAISLPLAFSRDGLPVGVQLVAAPGRDALLFSVAAQLMADAPARRPAVHA
jgi:amidase